jgi:hypothetical protein
MTRWFAFTFNVLVKNSPNTEIWKWKKTDKHKERGGDMNCFDSTHPSLPMHVTDSRQPTTSTTQQTLMSRANLRVQWKATDRDRSGDRERWVWTSLQRCKWLCCHLLSHHQEIWLQGDGRQKSEMSETDSLSENNRKVTSIITVTKFHVNDNSDSFFRVSFQMIMIGNDVSNKLHQYHGY